MKGFRILVIALLVLFPGTRVLADRLILKDGTVIEEVIIGDMGQEYFVVLIPKAAVESAVFTTTNTQTASAALSAYEANILKANNYPAEELAELKDLVSKAQSKVSGQILFKDKPIEGVSVALRRIQTDYSMGGLIKDPKDPARYGFYETVTDASGHYEFVGIPEGKYDLLWQSGTGKSWIRRLSAKPDVVIRRNEHLELKDINVTKRPIN